MPTLHVHCIILIHFLLSYAKQQSEMNKANFILVFKRVCTHSTESYDTKRQTL